jgi:hypothetical protein
VQGVEHQRQVAVSQLAGALVVAELDAREQLEQDRDVVEGDIRADRACGPSALEQLQVEVLGAGRRDAWLPRRARETPVGAAEASFA